MNKIRCASSVQASEAFIRRYIHRFQYFEDGINVRRGEKDNATIRILVLTPSSRSGRIGLFFLCFFRDSWSTCLNLALAWWSWSWHFFLFDRVLHATIVWIPPQTTTLLPPWLVHSRLHFATENTTDSNCNSYSLSNCRSGRSSSSFETLASFWHRLYSIAGVVGLGRHVYLRVVR